MGKLEPNRADKVPSMVRLVVMASWFVTILDFVFLRKGAYPPLPISVLGLILLTLGLGIVLIGRRTLGKYFSTEVRFLPDQKLVTTGVYRYIRHPLYLGQILLFSSIPLIFSSLYGFLISLIVIPLFLHRIAIEEKAMTERFGENYTIYSERTKRLIPYLY
jgi:protein-S-isoprenylcysteine O-methyltransferase Ste14